MIQAGTYSATLQYLKAVKAAGTKDTDAVAKKLKELPVDDAFTSNAASAGQWTHGVTTSICSRSRSRPKARADWDYYKLLATVPGDKAYPDRRQQRLPVDEVMSMTRRALVERGVFSSPHMRTRRLLATSELGASSMILTLVGFTAVHGLLAIIECRLMPRLFRLDAGPLDDLSIMLKLALQIGAPLLGLGGQGPHALPVKLVNHIGGCQRLRHLVA